MRKILHLIGMALLFHFSSNAQSTTQQHPANACDAALNNGFEIPVIPPANLSFVNAASVPNWSTTAPDNIIEIWSSGFQGVPSYEGNQFAELNANVVSTLIKNFNVQANVPLTISFAHRGRLGVDVMSVEVGPAGGPYTPLGTYSDNNTAWGFYQMPYTPPTGGAYQLRFVSVSAAGGNPGIGNFLDGVDPGSPAIVSVIQPPPTMTCNNVILDGSGSTSGPNIVYQWTTSNGTIVGSSTGNTVTVAAPGTYTLTATNAVLGCTNSSSVTVTANPVTANAGTDQSFCGTTTTAILSGNSQSSNGVWTLVSGSGNITNPNSPNTTVTNLGIGDNIFAWTFPTGVCTSTDQVTIHLDQPVTPTFAALPNICNGSTAPVLPATSTNGITGTWSPATVSNTTTGTYTFTPNAPQCALPTTLTQTVVSPVTPTFTALPDICNGSTAPVLPTTSTNGITGTWSPATVSNTVTGTYTFTPNAGECAVTTTLSQTVIPNITPTFNALPDICTGATAPVLPATSTNGVTGTWSPATVSNTATGTYTFTPAAGQCTTGPVTLTQNVSGSITPVFTALPAICSGSVAPSLPTVSNNGVTGAWSPATVSNTATATYTFTPDPGQCAVTATLTQNITPNTTPAFTPLVPICTGSAAPVLPTTSNNGISGTWSPATVNNTATGTYVFTPNAAGPCAVPVTVTQTVLTPTVPAFTPLAPICTGDAAPLLNNTSLNGITGTWSPSTVSNTASGVYTFTADPNQCAVGVTTLSLTVNPLPTVFAGNDTTVFALHPFILHAHGATTYTWSPASLITANANSDHPTAVISSPQLFTVTAIDANGCKNSDAVQVNVPDRGTYHIPNSFSPNGDGLNEVFHAIPDGIAVTAYFNVWNRWGQLIFSTTDLRKGWDGTFEGKKQPSGSYVWSVKGVSTSGKTVEMTGFVQVIR